MSEIGSRGNKQKKPNPEEKAFPNQQAEAQIFIGDSEMPSVWSKSCFGRNKDPKTIKKSHQG